MRAFLEVINGRYAGTTYLVETGDACTVGARLGADLFLPNDSLLAPLHFAVTNAAENIIVEKLSREIFVNNENFEKGEIKHGDFIFAGETLFQLTIDGEEIENESVLGRLIERLFKVENLYLLIDENLDSRILPVLNEKRASFLELKKEQKGFEAMTANPLVVIIGGNRQLLETLVRSFWGKGWLVFFKANKHRAEIFRYLQFLLAKTQINGAGDLRFYDPRMLRVVLGEAEKKYAQFFFGAAEKYYIESQIPGHLFEFARENGNVKADLIRFSKMYPKIPTQNEISEFLAGKNINGDFFRATEVCLQYFLPDNSKEIQALANESLPLFQRYKIETTAAKIQLVALISIFGTDYGESSELIELFESTNRSADGKLVFLVGRLNRNRG